MPFLYNLIRNKIEKDISEVETKDKDEEQEESNLADSFAEVEAGMADVVIDHLQEDDQIDPKLRKNLLTLSEHDVNIIEGYGLIAQTVCAMVAFACNRRHNAHQMRNSLMFLSAGVTERVSSCLNYLGLCSLRRTAHAALQTLGRQAKDTLKKRFELGPVLPPSICFDNLDFQQKVHMKSVGHYAIMFHGTWGYLHSPPASILPHLDPAEMTIKALNRSLHLASKKDVMPDSFAISRESNDHFALVLKSQITRVILEYVAVPIESHASFQRNPPPVRPIPPESPNVSMLKLMIVPDNSAQGVGEVFTGIIQQSGLTNDDFHSRVQIIEGDLGSCNIFDTLRSQRTPGRSNKASLHNVLPIPGAAHTLWNIAQAIFLHHWGDKKHCRDTGAWRTLHALGIPANKPVTKKDFNLMLSHIERIHKVGLLYFALITLEKNQKPQGQARRDFSAVAPLGASKSPAYWNMLLRICDFATVVKASRAMKAGDPGRLMFMWEHWAIMTQALPKLPHYSKHLPKLILTLKEALLKSLSRVFESTLLISPTGRANKFVATDCFLELQNYWLKYFFNHSGIGTNINRLKDVFSINIPVLLKLESGSNYVSQTHQNHMDIQSINNFLRMAEKEELNQLPSTGFTPAAVTDVYTGGIKKLQAEYIKGTKGLSWFKPFSPGIYQLREEEQDEINAMQTENNDSKSSDGLDTKDFSDGNSSE
ncbi:hypothetical protein PCANC_00916 [Puccinia coronata f. sp. avenae]|uniref:DUF6589 domain-containing protein n=1 Tax=Puccinia coronata f. sp. avenae TaxID=200324 RepID=A0A2N5W7N4_9BASI|nr:hypothetical protein PCANC_00916 [Puccinia coronata f. sp. avenae]